MCLDRQRTSTCDVFLWHGQAAVTGFEAGGLTWQWQNTCYITERMRENMEGHVTCFFTFSHCNLSGDADAADLTDPGGTSPPLLPECWMKSLPNVSCSSNLK